MPSLRLYPLLLAGAACLTLAACGSDDDPPPQASAPTQTESAAPTETAPPTQTPTTTAPDAAAPSDSNGSADDAETPSDTPAATPDETSTTPQSDGDASSGATKKSESSPPSSDKDDSDDTVSEALKVREALLALQLAFAAKDGQKACSYMIGVPKKSADPKNPGISCESLSQGEKTRLSEQDRAVVATAKVKVNGNEASAELGPGVPMTLRKINGRWRVDYTEMAKPAGAAG